VGARRVVPAVLEEIEGVLSETPIGEEQECSLQREREREILPL
jgi:hypothetical protein